MEFVPEATSTSISPVSSVTNVFCVTVDTVSVNGATAAVKLPLLSLLGFVTLILLLYVRNNLQILPPEVIADNSNPVLISVESNSVVMFASASLLQILL